MKTSKKTGYEAPTIEATSFVTESGYAASVQQQVKISVSSGSL